MMIPDANIPIANGMIHDRLVSGPRGFARSAVARGADPAGVLPALTSTAVMGESTERGVITAALVDVLPWRTTSSIVPAGRGGFCSGLRARTGAPSS